MRGRRIGMVVAAVAGAWCAAALVGMPRAAPAAPDDATLRLMQRIASNYGHGTVLVGQLPKDLPASVPLPQGTLLGSVTHEQRMGANGNVRVVGGPVVLYFEVPGDREAAVRAYEGTLRGAGWKQSDFEKRMPFNQGGFTVATPRAEQWCSAGDRPTIVNVAIPPDDRTALDVSVISDQQGAGMICNPGAFPFGDIGKSPLPTFSAGTGVTIEHAGPAADGTTTGARIISSLAIDAVFETFAKQLRDAGWAPGAAATAAALRSQTFTKTVDGKNYVALLSLNALDATHYVALADVSSL